MKQRAIIAALTVILFAELPAQAAAQSSYDSSRPILIGVLLGVTIGLVVKLATAQPRASSATQLRAAFDPWIGRDINDLIQRWGAPSLDVRCTGRSVADLHLGACWRRDAAPQRLWLGTRVTIGVPRRVDGHREPH